jgi:hypothetical protein
MKKKNTAEGSHVILVRKASGETEPFDIQKLERSLQKSGAADDLISEILNNISDWVYDGASTKLIYTRAFSLLRKKKNITATKYKLKQAILQLGPTGYPFEHFIGLVFQKQGYQVQTGKFIEGHCVTHEMDVIATKGNSQHLIECKYSSQGRQVSIQVPLYVQSRIEDIIKKRKEMPDYDGFTFSGGIVTNTRFSSDSVDYAKCIGLKLLGWDYPAGNALKDIIENTELYPVTVLNSINKKEKEILINQGIVICSQLLQKPENIKWMRLSPGKQKQLMEELSVICGENKA